MADMAKTSTEEHAEPGNDGSVAASRMRWVEVALLGVAAIFVGLHFVHLKADFPNYSFWKDWSKFTDEGWYGDGAIRLYQTGRWDAPGDFNPGAALPVWPMLLAVLFRLTGVSLVAARALTVTVFGLTLVSCYLLLRRWWGGGKDRNSRSLGPAMVVLLLAVSPFYFAFSRMAILEPLLILLTVAAMLVASKAGEAAASEGRGWVGWMVGLGLMLPVMVLTKTTAAFLFPAILWVLWVATGYRWRALLRVAAPAAAIGAAGWGAYYGLAVRPHYLLDYRYLFDANAYTGFTWSGLGWLLYDTVYHGIWIGKTLFALALIATAGAVVTMFAKGARAHPMRVTMLLWVLGYGAFLAYHANLQPRYYVVLAVPLTALVVMVLEPLFVAAVKAAEPGRAVDAVLMRVVAGVLGAALVFAAGTAARQTVGFVLHPDYSWVAAAAEIDRVVEQEARRSGHSKMVLSISGADLSLMTGLPSICDDFGTMNLPDRIAAYKPGWFATWNEVEDDKMESLAPMYRLERAATVPAFDDPDRNVLILYRLDAVSTPGHAPPPRRRRSMFVLRSLRTKIGEQPSVEQLKH